MEDFRGAFGIFIECKVQSSSGKPDDIDYGKYLTSITVMRSPSSPYTVYKLHFDLIQEIVKLATKAFKSTPTFNLKLDYYFSSNQKIKKRKDLKLLVMDINSVSKSVALESGRSTSSHLLPLIVYAIPLKAFYNATLTVNKIFEKKPLKSIINEIGGNADIEFEESGTINSDEIDQLIIPPMSLYRSLRYLDYYYSIYKESAAYCWFTDDKESKCKIFCPAKFNKEHIKISTITHRQDNTDDTTGEDVVRWGADGFDKKFYGFSDIGFRDDRMASAMMSPYNYHFVYKPTDNIYKVHDNTFDDILNQSCFIDKSVFVPVPTGFKKNDRFNLYIEHTGFDETDYYTKNWFFRQFKKNNEVVFDHHGYIDWDQMIPGYVAVWNPTDENSQKEEFIGRYLIDSVISTVGKSNTEGWFQRNVFKLHRANVDYKEG